MDTTEFRELVKRALLDAEYATAEGIEGDDACPSCGVFVFSGQEHDEGCPLDAALTELGLPDQASRRAARGQ